MGAVGRKVERKSVHPPRSPHYKAGALLCTLDVKDKLRLVAQDLVDPITILSLGFNAGIGQAENSDPPFGQGAAGYGKRFGAGVADTVSGGSSSLFSTRQIFSEDPR